MPSNATLIPTLIFIALLLRILPGFDKFLFSYDQARDLIVADQILNGDFKLVGPPSDIQALFHGPIYYYFLAVVMFITAHNINLIFSAIIIINILTIIPVVLISKELFPNKNIALVSGLLFAVSFSTISYGRLLSNVSMALPALGLYYLGLARLLRNKNDGWILASLGLGIALQSQLFLSYLLLVTPVFLYVFRIKFPGLRLLFKSSLTLIVLLSTFLIAEIRFKFQGLTGIINYFKSGLELESIKGERLANFIAKFDEFLRSNINFESSLLTWLVFGIFLLMAFIAIKRKSQTQRSLYFLLFFLVSNLFTYVITKFDAAYINIGLLIPFLILCGASIIKISERSKLAARILLIIIIFSNLYTIYKSTKKGESLFQIQQNVTLNDRMNVVKKTYEISQNEMFSINAATLPLYHPTTWAYLYNYYAQNNGYKLPHYHGNTASQFVGDHIFPRSGEITKYEFTIIEPDTPTFWAQEAIESDNLRTRVVNEYQINGYTLQVRQRK